MLVKVATKTTEYTVDIDVAWVWVRVEQETGLTLTEAQSKMADGSTLIITKAIWVASETDQTFNEWVRTLVDFEVIDDDPKESAPA